MSDYFPATQERWEPHAAPYHDRRMAFRRAAQEGLNTWASIEPVLDATAALDTIWLLAKIGVDHFKLGKLSGHDAKTRALERVIDWREYRQVARSILKDEGYTEIHTPGAFEVGTFYVKRELEEAT